MICEPQSNLFDWRKVRRFENFVIDLAERMKKYRALGAKPESFKAYQSINYVSNLISGLDQNEVDAYHSGFGKILKWLNLAIATRR